MLCLIVQGQLSTIDVNVRQSEEYSPWSLLDNFLEHCFCALFSTSFASGVEKPGINLGVKFDPSLAWRPVRGDTVPP
jgi:hypothetical protein